MVYGAGVSAVPAVRLKNQLNENTKLAAFAGEVPEICHNEIEGWAWGRRAAPLSAVMLSAPGTHPRLVQRLEVLRELFEGEGAPVVELARARRRPGGPRALAGAAGRPACRSIWPTCWGGRRRHPGHHGFKQALD